MKKTLQSLSILLASCAAAHAQVAPAATAGAASWDYSLHYAQTAEFGGSLGDWQTILATGMVSYRNGNARLPFLLNYAGGYSTGIEGRGYENGLYQRLFVTQGMVWRKWRISVGDSLSYLPLSPVTGFSGVPGTGEPVGGTNPAPPTDQNVLTVNTHAVDNFVDVAIEDRISFDTTITASGSDGILRYPDGNGYETNSESANVGVSQRLDARMSLTGSYAYSHFGYPGSDVTFDSNTIYAGFKRQWNKKLSTIVSGGPQWTSGNNSTLIPSSTNFAINVAAQYHFNYLSAGLMYTRGDSNGAGYLLGARSDIVTLSISRPLGRNLTLGAEASYRRLVELNHAGAIDSETAGIQASRKIGRHLSAVVSYTAIDQATSAVVPSNVLGQLLQTVSIGIGYSPREMRIVR